MTAGDLRSERPVETPRFRRLSEGGLTRGIAAIARESWLLFLAVSAANASNYVFHVSISRLLGPEDYGALGSVLGILTVLSIPLSAVQAAVAKGTAQVRSPLAEERSYSWVGPFGAAFKAGLAIAVIMALLSPVVTAYLHLGSWATALLMSAYVVPAVLLAVTRGALQGEIRFKELAMASLFPVVIRLGAGLPIVALGGGVPGATLATVLGDVGGLALAMWLLARRQEIRLGLDAVVRPFLKEVAPVALGLLAMWVLIELDLIMARHYLPEDEAGNYAAAGLLARAVLFIPGAVSLIALPHFSVLGARGREAYRWLVVSSAAVVGLGVAAALVLSTMRGLAIGITFGSEFSPAAQFLPVLSLAMVGMGLANLMIFFHIAAESRVAHLLWFAVALEAAAMVLFHGSGQVLASIVVLGAWPVAALGFLTARSVALSPPPLSRLPSDLAISNGRRAGAMGAPELSVVIPCHNMGDRLSVNVATVVTTLDHLGHDYEVMVVSDGSTDGCEQPLTAPDSGVSVVRYEQRQGKGTALRVGMTRATGRYVAFVDSDGDLDSSDLRPFLALMDLYGPDLVVGSKRHPLSSVHYPLARRLMSWMYQRLVRTLFGLKVRDTQTGMKLIRRDVLDAVVPRMLEKRFAFDLEFLVVAKRLGFTRIFEAPISLDYKFESTVSPRAVFLILLDTAAIYYRRYILRFYDQPVTDLIEDREQSVVPLAFASAEQGISS